MKEENPDVKVPEINEKFRLTPAWEKLKKSYKRKPKKDKALPKNLNNASPRKKMKYTKSQSLTKKLTRWRAEAKLGY